MNLKEQEGAKFPAHSSQTDPLTMMTLQFFIIASENTAHPYLFGSYDLDPPPLFIHLLFLLPSVYIYIFHPRNASVNGMDPAILISDRGIRNPDPDSGQR